MDGWINKVEFTAQAAQEQLFFLHRRAPPRGAISICDCYDYAYESVTQPPPQIQQQQYTAIDIELL